MARTKNIAIKTKNFKAMGMKYILVDPKLNRKPKNMFKKKMVLSKLRFRPGEKVKRNESK